jgi:hypothetical protein
MSPLPLITSRLEVIADGDGGSVNVRRWLGDPDLVSMLLVPTRPDMLVRLAPGVEPDDLRRRVVGVLRRARRAAEGEG